MNIGMTKAIASQAAKDEIAKGGLVIDNVARTGVQEVKSQLDETIPNTNLALHKSLNSTEIYVKNTNKRIVNEGVVKRVFDGTTSDWQFSTSNTIIEYGDKNIFNSKKSVKITSNDKTKNPTTYKNINIDNLTDESIIQFTFYIPPDRYYDLDMLRIYLLNSSDLTSWDTNNAFHQVLVYNLTPGWNHYKVKKKDFTIKGNTTFTQFLGMKIMILNSATASNPAEIHFDSCVVDRKIRPSVLLNFDDSMPTLYSHGYPYMKQNNMSGTIHVSNRSFNPNYKGLSTLFMDMLAHKDVYNNGWDLSLHSKTHNDIVDLRNNFNYAEQYEDLAYNFNFLIKNGFVGTPISFAAPNGKWNYITINILESLGVKNIRTSSTGYISGDYSSGIAYLATQEIQNSTTIETIKSWIDRAIEYGVAVSIFTHGTTIGNTDPYSMDYSVFTQMIDYIKSKVDLGLIDVQTFSDFYYSCVGRTSTVTNGGGYDGGDLIPSTLTTNIGNQSQRYKNTYSENVVTKNMQFNDYVGKFSVNGVNVFSIFNNRMTFDLPIYPTNDNAVDFGTSVSRFKNMYLRGYITLGKCGSGTRPTLASTDDGTLIYDSGFKKMILWNGTAWVNMDGSVLS